MVLFFNYKTGRNKYYIRILKKKSKNIDYIYIIKEANFEKYKNIIYWEYF